MEEKEELKKGRGKRMSYKSKKYERKGETEEPRKRNEKDGEREGMDEEELEREEWRGERR